MCTVSSKARVVAGLGLLAVLVGCSASVPSGIDKSPEVYRIQTRRLPPEPVYNRVIWAHLPDIEPGRDLPESDAGHVVPVATMALKNATLEEASRSLAGIAQYASYCSSTIAKQKISFNQLGTLDELAEAIGRNAGIRVVVDHEGRSVRFLPLDSGSPRFYSGADR
ncbi:MAG: hypothetical protein EBZ48_14105 [Proteobacteria bacterium]|nr:hypothetical protein [Pseudomonadota bacterium]